MTDKRILALAPAVLILSVVLGGCAGFGKTLRTPEIRLAGISLEKVDLFETVLQLQLRVINGNDVPLALKGVECELDLNDKSVATGVSGSQVTIPALDSKTVAVTVYASALSMATSFMGFIRKEMDESGNKDISYRLKGRLHIEGGTLMPSALSFKAAGNLPLRETFERMTK